MQKKILKSLNSFFSVVQRLSNQTRPPVRLHIEVEIVVAQARLLNDSSKTDTEALQQIHGLAKSHRPHRFCLVVSVATKTFSVICRGGKLLRTTNTLPPKESVGKENVFSLQQLDGCCAHLSLHPRRNLTGQAFGPRTQIHSHTLPPSCAHCIPARPASHAAPAAPALTAPPTACSGSGRGGAVEHNCPYRLRAVRKR